MCAVCCVLAFHQLFFAPGDYSASFTVWIMDDSCYEEESEYVDLTAPTALHPHVIPATPSHTLRVGMCMQSTWCPCALPHAPQPPLFGFVCSRAYRALGAHAPSHNHSLTPTLFSLPAPSLCFVVPVLPPSLRCYSGTSWCRCTCLEVVRCWVRATQPPSALMTTTLGKGGPRACPQDSRHRVREYVGVLCADFFCRV